jgi:hypothetical protein
MPPSLTAVRTVPVGGGRLVQQVSFSEAIGADLADVGQAVLGPDAGEACSG